MSDWLLTGYHLLQRSKLLTLYPWHRPSATSVWFLAARFGCKKRTPSVNIPENLMVRPSFTYMFLGSSHTTHVYRRIHGDNIWQRLQKCELYTPSDDTMSLKSCIYFPPNLLKMLIFAVPTLSYASISLSSFPKTNNKIHWFGACSTHFPRANQTVTCMSPHWNSFPSLHSI